MEHFCYLNEHEDKAFQYTKMYIAYLRQHNKNVFSLDNSIQRTEIELHLKRLGVIAEERRMQESINWVNNYAKNFRVYINTLKLIAFVMYCDHEDCNFENFIDKLKNLNSLKIDFIDSIF